MRDAQLADLISKIAHELRSPLTSVKGFSSTLVRRWDRFTDEQRLQLVRTIHADAERMARMVSEVLDLARLETGRLELNTTRVPLASVATRAVANAAELPGAERVSVDVADGVVAWGDEERLGRVMTNLVEHAVTLSDQGAVEVKARHAEPGVVEVTVAAGDVDTEGDRLANLLTEPAGRSGGFGLYLSRRLLEAHGGSLGVESRPGVGATFTARLPAAEEDR